MGRTVTLNTFDSHHELIFNRPEKLNALSPELITEFHQLLKVLSEEKPKILLLKGAGTSFSSGHDLETVLSLSEPENLQKQLLILQEITHLLVNYPAPVVTALKGYALGAGYEIALNSDIIYAADDVVIGFPEVQVGLSITQGSSYLLQKMVGSLKAKELIFFSKRINASEALKLGLVNDLMPTDELDDYVLNKVKELSKVNLQTLAELKKLFHYSRDHNLTMSMKKEVATLVTLLTGSIKGE